MTDERTADSTDAPTRPDREAEWEGLRTKYLHTRDTRPPSAARGLHHVALVSSDVERTIRFYQLGEMYGSPVM